jgi:hypothetical protein
MGQFVGTLLVVVLITRLFMWLTKKFLPRLDIHTQILLANALSLAAYTVAMGYSLVPDLTVGEAPHLVAAFQIGVVPQLLCLGGNFAYSRAHWGQEKGNSVDAQITENATPDKPIAIGNKGPLMVAFSPRHRGLCTSLLRRKRSRRIPTQTDTIAN